MKRAITTTLFSMLVGLGFSQTWNQVTVPTSENLLDIEFPEDSFGVGYIGGENGVLLKTTDGGVTWAEVNYAGIDIPVDVHFRDLEFANAEVGYAALAETSGLYETTDGGQNWTAMDDPSIGSFCFRSTLHVFDENQFIASGAGCFSGAMIVAYNNGTWSWPMMQYSLLNADHYVRDMEFRDSLGIAAVNSHFFLRSTDTGQTWDTIASPILSPSGNLTDVIIVNDTLMLAGHEIGNSHPTFFQSNDAGLTWGEMQPTGGDVVPFASWLAFEMSSNGDLYASATQADSTHYMHEKNGPLWSPEQVEEQIVSIDSHGTDFVYAVGNNGYVIVNSGPGSSIEEQLEPAVNVFPNPASTHVTITVEAPFIHADYQLWDAQGRMMSEGVLTGINTTLNTFPLAPGNYVVSIGHKAGVLRKQIIIQK